MIFYLKNVRTQMSCSEITRYIVDDESLFKLREDLIDAQDSLEEKWNIYFDPSFFMDYFWFKFNYPGPNYSFWAPKVLFSSCSECDEEFFFTVLIKRLYKLDCWNNVIVSRGENFRFCGIFPPPPIPQNRDKFIEFVRQFPTCKLETREICLGFGELKVLASLSRQKFKKITNSIASKIGFVYQISFENFKNRYQDSFIDEDVSFYYTMIYSELCASETQK